MNNDELIRMANQIATFYTAYPEDEALESVADHLQRFWEPRMRAQLKEQVANGAKGLSPLAQAALERIH
jgi:formate dehydrogenase subunit delta